MHPAAAFPACRESVPTPSMWKLARPIRRRSFRATTNGLYLKGVTGYGINPVSGDFSGGAQGFWIQNGRLAFPVMGLTIAASADEMLNGIDMLGTIWT